MENSENILNEIKKMAPTLSNIKKENSFYASDQYFDALSVHLQQKISTKHKENYTLHLMSYFLKPQFAIAASLILILSVGTLYFYQTKSTQSIAQNNTIYWDEILNDNSTVYDKLDEALLIEVLTNEATTYNNHKTNKVHQPIENTIDEVADEIESSYSNDIFNDL